MKIIGEISFSCRLLCRIAWTADGKAALFKGVMRIGIEFFPCLVFLDSDPTDQSKHQLFQQPFMWRLFNKASASFFILYQC